MYQQAYLCMYKGINQTSTWATNCGGGGGRDHTQKTHTLKHIHSNPFNTLRQTQPLQNEHSVKNRAGQLQLPTMLRSSSTEYDSSHPHFLFHFTKNKNKTKSAFKRSAAIHK